MQAVEVFALDDHFVVGRVERLQHHAVAPLEVTLQGALALVAVDQHAQVAIFQRVLLVHQRQVAVLDAGLHAVTADHEIEIVGGVFHPGILLPVILLKGQGTVPGLDGPDDRDQALGIVAKEPLFRRVAAGDRAVQPQQKIRRGAQDLRNAGDRCGVRGGLAAFPLADGLLGAPQLGRQFRLAHALLLAALLQKL